MAEPWTTVRPGRGALIRTPCPHDDSGIHPSVASLTLVFHEGKATVDRDPQVLAARLTQHYALLDLGPRQGWERSFLHRSSSAAAGKLMITCGYTSPIQGLIGEGAERGSINICCADHCHDQVEQRRLDITPERPMFFDPE